MTNFKFESIYSNFNSFVGTEIIINNIDSSNDDDFIFFKNIINSYMFPINFRSEIVLFFNILLKEEYRAFLKNNGYIEEHDDTFNFKYTKNQYVENKIDDSNKIKVPDLNYLIDICSENEFIKEKINKIENCIYEFNCFYTKYQKYPKSITAETINYQILCLACVKDIFLQIAVNIENKKFKDKINEEKLNKEIEYIESLRSIVAAHPFRTSKHPKFEFDGHIVCLDTFLNNGGYASFLRESDFAWKYMDLNGLNDDTDKKDGDILLYTIQKKEDSLSCETIIIEIKIEDLVMIYNKLLKELYSYKK